jgi:NTE family protein
MSIDKNLKWALVLSGGGAKGLAHVGVLTALAELGFPEPSLIVGTSMGAIVGGLYACGMSPAEICRFVREEFDITEYLDSFVFKLAGPVGRIFQAGQVLGKLASSPGVDTGNQVLGLLERLTGGKTFAETRIPFRCNAVDLFGGEEVIFRSGSVARAIRASMSFPIFFEPLREGGMYLVDGGLADNMPVRVAREEGFRWVLAVDVGAFRTVSSSACATGFRIAYRSLEIALNRGRNVRQTVRPDLLIYAVNKHSPFSFFRKEEFIALGERAVRENEQTVAAFFSRGLKVWAFRRRRLVCGIRPPDSIGDSPLQSEEKHEQTEQEYRRSG